MWLPSTFQHHHQGPSETWQHATGGRSRIDYLAVPLQFQDHHITTWVAEEVDVELSRVDHLPLGMELTLWKPEEAANTKKRIPRHTPEPFTSLWPSSPWDIDVNSHAEWIEGQLRSEHHQSNPNQRRRKQHLSDETWNTILAKKVCWKQIRKVRQDRHSGYLRVIFGRWKSWTTHKAVPELGYQPWVKWTWLEEARLSFLYRRFAREVTTAVRKDDVQYYDNLAARAGEVDSVSGLKELWRELRATLPRAINRKKLNTHTRQPDERAMYDHFDQLEAGEAKQFETIAKECIHILARFPLVTGD